MGYEANIYTYSPGAIAFQERLVPGEVVHIVLRDRGFNVLRLFVAVLDFLQAGCGADFVLIPARRAAGADCADDFASHLYWDRTLHYEPLRSDPGKRGVV